MSQIKMTLTKTKGWLAKALDGNLDEATRKATMAGVAQVTVLVAGEANALAPVDTGALAGSLMEGMRFDESKLTGVVSSDKEYAPFLEYGTGVYAENGRGRQTPWKYTDAMGQVHWTKGGKPQPFLRPAVENNRVEILAQFSAKVAQELGKE